MVQGTIELGAVAGGQYRMSSDVLSTSVLAQGTVELGAEAGDAVSIGMPGEQQLTAGPSSPQPQVESNSRHASTSHHNSCFDTQSCGAGDYRTGCSSWRCCVHWHA